jgi:hypothetical protein
VLSPLVMVIFSPATPTCVPIGAAEVLELAAPVGAVGSGGLTDEQAAPPTTVAAVMMIALSAAVPRMRGS